MRILVVDVGGSHVKILATGQRQARRFDSGPTMTAKRMALGVKELNGHFLELVPPNPPSTQRLLANFRSNSNECPGPSSYKCCKDLDGGGIIIFRAEE